MSGTSKSIRTGRGGPQAENLRRTHLVSGQTLTCCGQPMQPQLVQARDVHGYSLFVTLWRCAQCGRAVY